MATVHYEITLAELIYSVLLLAGTFLLVWIYQNNKKKSNPIYKWYLPGLFIKVFGGIALVLVYVFYYDGGDVIAYYYNSKVIVNKLYSDPEVGLQFLIGKNDPESFSLFRYDTGVPFWYLYKNPQSWAVSRFSVPFVITGLGYILPATIILNIVAFIGPWKFTKTLVKLYPNFERNIVVAFLFFPSCVFWGSGLMKDSFTFSATLWILASVLQIAKFNNKVLINLLIIVIGSYIIINLKPYILVALLTALPILFLLTFINRIRIRFIRYISVPLISLAVVAGGLYLFSILSSALGMYGSMEEAFEKIVISREDFINNELYSSNYFDIGAVEPTLSSILSKSHLALLYGLFSPFPWNVNSAVMLLSAAESLLILFLFLKMILLIMFKRRSKLITNDNVVFSFLIFVIFFTIFVGVSTANFGAMVRYRIPAYPLFLFILLYVGSKKHDTRVKRRDH